ncbi:phosphotransferase [Thiotrichales bacterium 19S9-12]|nr:phosphotransferase [Thiotrichales bacterium 19S9-11]MCF6811289.1 phosphotransferase [Thiotrichales bacterium 19S9-12]
MTFQRSRLIEWLVGYYGDNQFEIDFLAGDASFRRYYRVKRLGKSYVLMDASSEKEKLKQFYDVGNLFSGNDVLTPEVLHLDLVEGLCLLRDFGNRLLFDVFQDEKNNQHYKMCLDELVKINQIDKVAVPEYSYEKFIEEANRMNEWFFELIKLKTTKEDKVLLDGVFHQLADLAKEQPQVCLHRDYHSKNIMVLDNHKLGVIDYQDSVCGPIAYDLVSLLRDCYISWPNQVVNHWVEVYYQMLIQKEILDGTTHLSAFEQWFNWTGMQRHIKCLGIFACLYVRDSRPTYLGYIPTVANYIRSVAQGDDKLQSFYKFWQNKIQPKMDLLNLEQVAAKE